MKQASVFFKGIIFALILFAGGELAHSEELIQLAILLDTSNSMDGLIAQAKSQLWKIVNELARTEKNGRSPRLEVALFEYGNNNLLGTEGYVRMITDLTTDLDEISEELFALTTNGGDEYCGKIIDVAVRKLQWRSSREVLKVIYIAGNEPFTQGNVPYGESCSLASKKDIIVNTIFCGSHQEGIATSWKDGADIGGGKYMSIDQDMEIVQVSSPYDKEIERLGIKLNKTYVGYGIDGAANIERQSAQDANAASVGFASGVERSVAKAQSQYINSGWDLVDAVLNKVIDLKTAKAEDLPEPLRKMSLEEREAYVKKLIDERKKLQAEINSLNDKRREYIAIEMKKSESHNTLDTAILESVKEQADKKGFISR